MVSTLSVISLAEFLQRPNLEESPAWELIEGCPSQKPMPTFYHSVLQKKLTALIDSLGSEYEAFPELQCNLAEQSVVPDVVILHRSRLPQGNGALFGAPDGLIEILSPDQSTTKLIAKIQLCLSAGCRLAWLIDPHERLVMAFQSAGEFELLTGAQVLPSLEDLPLLLTVDEMFAWLG